MAIIVSGFITAFIFFFIWMAGHGANKTADGTPTTSAQIQRNCEGAIEELQAMRNQFCEKQREVSALRERLRQANQAANSALLEAAALMAAAVAATFIPVIGSFLASGFASASAIALARATYMNGTAQDIGQRLDRWIAQMNRAASEEQRAAANVRTNCGDRAQAAIDSLPAC